jgi:pimeloyl-ACP methyl ester carboxylesterase
MPYLRRPGATLFYDVAGDGPDTVITTHGLSECGAYWSRTGVSAALAGAGYRVVDMDMRAHGRSVPEEDAEPGYDVDHVAADIGALADHLGVDRFHLLTHATGGMAGLRYAMGEHQRLRSLISTDTGSATMPSTKYSDPDYDGPYPTPVEGPIDNRAVRGMEQYTIHEIMGFARKSDGRPFLSAFFTNEDPERCWRWAEDILGNGNPTHVSEFARHFFTDADPRIARLQQISCPNLVLLGELDELFLAPSELLARHLPQVEHVVVPGRGHMLAIEDPEGTAATIIDFLGST